MNRLTQLVTINRALDLLCLALEQKDAALLVKLMPTVNAAHAVVKELSEDPVREEDSAGDKQRSEAWAAVCAALDEEMPHFMSQNGNGRECAIRAVKSLGQCKRALDEWLEKTEWLQKDVQPAELGMHRADVLRQRLETEPDGKEVWINFYYAPFTPTLHMTEDNANLTADVQRSNVARRCIKFREVL